MPVERLEIYKCGVCGIVVEILDAGAGEPVCCGVPMIRQAPNPSEAHRPAHTPVARWREGELHVTVGSPNAPHPSASTHHVQWIEVLAGDLALRAFLSPGQDPRACFALPPGPVVVRMFCSRHGLWETTVPRDR